MDLYVVTTATVYKKTCRASDVQKFTSRGDFHMAKVLFYLNSMWVGLLNPSNHKIW